MLIKFVSSCWVGGGGGGWWLRVCGDGCMKYHKKNGHANGLKNEVRQEKIEESNWFSLPVLWFEENHQV